MKKNYLQFYIFLTVLLSDFMLFAQPGDGSDGPPLDGDDAPQAPINGKLLWLAIAGILFAIYTYRNKKHTA